jgi:hypothetical protein
VVAKRELKKDESAEINDPEMFCPVRLVTVVEARVEEPELVMFVELIVFRLAVFPFRVVAARLFTVAFEIVVEARVEEPELVIFVELIVFRLPVFAFTVFPAMVVPVKFVTVVDAKVEEPFT